jgi:hypothetical protein
MQTARELLSTLDEQIHTLVNERKALAVWIERAEEARKRGKMFHCMLTKAHKLRNSFTVRDYINTKLLAWKEHLSPSHFPLTLDALPESVSADWNNYEVQIFFMEAFDAFERDWDRLQG